MQRLKSEAGRRFAKESDADPAHTAVVAGSHRVAHPAADMFTYEAVEVDDSG